MCDTLHAAQQCVYMRWLGESATERGTGDGTHSPSPPGSQYEFFVAKIHFPIWHLCGALDLQSALQSVLLVVLVCYI